MTRHSRATAYRSIAPAARREAFFVVALLLFAQVSFLLHLAVYPHVISAATGKVSHPSSSSPYQSNGSKHQPTKPANTGHDDECQVFIILMQDSVVSAPLSLAMTEVPAGEGTAIPEFDQPRPHQWGLYRLSPSHSPPAVA